MAHVTVPAGAPGIVGLMQQFPDTEGPLNQLAEALLRGPSSLTPAERELVAAFVSTRNECRFCSNIHAAVARELYAADAAIVDQVCRDVESAPISDKLRALLVIAGHVQKDGRLVTEEDVSRARAAGADDRAIHDTVLIAAAFCMFNRYVDGLATTAPDAPEAYLPGAVKLATTGYLRSIR